MPAGITLIVIGCTAFSFAPHPAVFAPGVLITFLSIPILFTGFAPSLQKFGAKLQSETMEHAGKEITMATSKSAEVVSPAITKVAQSIKQAFDNSQIYCKHCGKLIDADSKFCKHCSEQQ